MEVHMKVILSLGLGVESSSLLLRWLVEPASRWFPLSDLIVAVAHTGEEWPDTKQLVETHLFPLLRGHAVRFVQLARNGPREEDGWVILDDSTNPTTLHIEGKWRLSDELRAAGTLPQCSNRRCSMKYKGWVLDQFIARALGGHVRRRKEGDRTLNIIDVPEPFEHVLGFNATEQARVVRDTTCGGPMRRARYPLMDWGWDRAACRHYLRAKTGADWVKSCCVACPFPNGNQEILARYSDFPEIAAQALLLEYVAVALNPHTTLYRDRTLLSAIVEDQNELALEAFNRLLARQEWAVYRVRRILTRQGGGDRSVEKVQVGSRAEMHAAIAQLSGETVADPFACPRFYLCRREKGVYPTREEFWVAAPALAQNKAKPSFDAHWARVALPMI
jgi:hypothetical protein